MATALIACSDKQQSFIRTLLSERQITDYQREQIGDPATLSKEAATKVIDWLTRQPQIKRLDMANEIGSYRKDDVIYRVRRSKTTGNLYATWLNPNTQQFEYEHGLIKTLTNADRMTLDEAKAYGVQFGICCVCAAPLTDPKSVAAGIGPVCGKRV